MTGELQGKPEEAANIHSAHFGLNVLSARVVESRRRQTLTRQVLGRVETILESSAAATTLSIADPSNPKVELQRQTFKRSKSARINEKDEIYLEELQNESIARGVTVAGIILAGPSFGYEAELRALFIAGEAIEIPSVGEPNTDELDALVLILDYLGAAQSSD